MIDNTVLELFCAEIGFSVFLFYNECKNKDNDLSVGNCRNDWDTPQNVVYDSYTVLIRYWYILNETYIMCHMIHE